MLKDRKGPYPYPKRDVSKIPMFNYAEMDRQRFRAGGAGRQKVDIYPAARPAAEGGAAQGRRRGAAIEGAVRQPQERLPPTGRGNLLRAESIVASQRPWCTPSSSGPGQHPELPHQRRI